MYNVCSNNELVRTTLYTYTLYMFPLNDYAQQFRQYVLLLSLHIIKFLEYQAIVTSILFIRVWVDSCALPTHITHAHTESKFYLNGSDECGWKLMLMQTPFNCCYRHHVQCTNVTIVHRHENMGRHTLNSYMAGHVKGERTESGHWNFGDNETSGPFTNCSHFRNRTADRLLSAHNTRICTHTFSGPARLCTNGKSFLKLLACAPNYSLFTGWLLLFIHMWLMCQ